MGAEGPVVGVPEQRQPATQAAGRVVRRQDVPLTHQPGGAAGHPA